jgi:hypothetical protein
MCIVSLLLALCDVFSFGRFSNRSSTPPLLVQSPPRASTCVNLATANPFTHTHKHKHAGTSTHAQPVLLFSEITVRLCVNHVRFWPSQECKRWAVRRRTVVVKFRLCVCMSATMLNLARTLPHGYCHCPSLPVYSYHPIAHRKDASATNAARLCCCFRDSQLVCAKFIV